MTAPVLPHARSCRKSSTAVRNQLALGCDGVIQHGATPSELAPIVDEYRRTAAPAGP